MSDLIKLRASGLPLALRCAGSVHGDPRVDETNDAADLGTAVHEALRSLVELGSVNWDSMPALAKRYGVPEDELRMLTVMGAKLWTEVSSSFPDALTEHPLEHVFQLVSGGPLALTGHADILSITAGAARIADWKTGRNDSDHAEQARAYCALALLSYPDLEEATCTLLWVREGEAENYTMRATELDTWLEELVEKVVRWDGVFHTGKHCQYCPRSHACTAVNAMARRDIAIISDSAAADIANMPAAEVVALLEKADLVANLAKRVREVVKERVREHGDIIGNGKRLTLVTEERRGLKTLDAFPVLEAAGLGDEEMARVINISLSETERVVAQLAGKGKGAGAVREFRSKLEAAGAIEINTIEKLVAKRA